MTPDYIDQANRWFKDHLAELLRTNAGKWVVIFDGNSLGVYDTEAQAYQEGIRQAKSEKIVIRQIKQNPDDPIEISVNFTLGLLNVRPRKQGISPTDSPG